MQVCALWLWVCAVKCDSFGIPTASVVQTGVLSLYSVLLRTISNCKDLSMRWRSILFWKPSTGQPSTSWMCMQVTMATFPLHAACMPLTSCDTKTREREQPLHAACMPLTSCDTKTREREQLLWHYCSTTWLQCCCVVQHACHWPSCDTKTL